MTCGRFESRRGIAAECWRFLDCDAGRTFPAVYAKACVTFTTGNSAAATTAPTRRPMNILLTGFGPFPGAPFNPTGPLVEKLVRSRRLALAGVRRTSRTSSAPAMRRSTASCRRCWQRTKPDVLVMFGLAARTRHVRIETRARNSYQPRHSGCRRPPAAHRYDRTGSRGHAARCASRRNGWCRAARATGVEAALSHDAGRYLCNYLCWRATEAAARPDGPKVAAFVHVPKVRATGSAPRAVNLRPARARRRSDRARGDRRRAHRPLTATAYGMPAISRRSVRRIVA